MKKSTKGLILTVFVVLMVVIDQVIKILVKTNMTLGESIHVFGDWFQIFFIENNGMAFGMQFGGVVGKAVLSILRIVLVILIFIYLRKLLKRDDTPMGVLIGFAAIMCGAFGNIIDCLFYGISFSASSYTEVATLFPPEGGYAGFLFGRVVDMFYFPIIDTTWPSWVPFVGGEEFIFFRPIFNFADACISVGVIYLIVFHWKFISRSLQEIEKKEQS